MSMEDRDQRFLRFARAIALVSGVAIPLGATMPACAEEQPPQYDAGLAIDAGITAADVGSTIADVAATEGIGAVLDAGRAPIDAGIAVEPDARDGIAVDVPPPGLRIDDVPEVGGDAASPDAALRDVPTIETTGGPMMPPEFDEARA